MRIKAAWIKEPTAQRVMGSLVDAGHQAYFVGGCVRNALLEAPVTDLDISTNAHPDQVLAMGKENGFKSLPTGIEHGTITWVVGDQPFEITTFRRDVETDGRRAVVAFADTMEEDAMRRDFTINALYADRDGKVIDPVGNISDLKARIIRFIGDPKERIREDYLRILRFFRFFSYYADQTQGFDADGLAACAELADGIDQLSKERIGTEIQKLLSADAPLMALSCMDQSGVLRRVISGASVNAIGPYIEFERRKDWLGRLFALGGENVEKALRLNKASARRLDSLKANVEKLTPIAEIAYRHGHTEAEIAAAFRAAQAQMPCDWSVLDTEIENAAKSEFPLKAKDLPDLFGPRLGATLRAAEADWIKSGFNLSKEALAAKYKDGA